MHRVAIQQECKLALALSGINHGQLLQDEVDHALSAAAVT
jgi:hypothetical protein